MMVRWILVGTFLFLASCAALDSRPPEEVVAERAAKHLEHLRLQNWDEALRFTSPAFRSVNSADQYSFRYRGSGAWLETRIGKVECEAAEPGVCEVATYIKTRRPGFSYSTERYRPRTWLLIDGKWDVYEPPK